jgi:hypothetical protein
MRYGEDAEDNGDSVVSMVNGDDAILIESSLGVEEGTSEDQDELYFDYDTMRWQTRPTISGHQLAVEANIEEDVPDELYFDYDTMRWQSRTTNSGHQLAVEANIEEDVPRENIEVAAASEEVYFDNDTMRWKTRTAAAVEDNGGVDRKTVSTGLAEDEQPSFQRTQYEADFLSEKVHEEVGQ